MSSFKSERRDQAIAHEAHESRALMCTAHGCPNVWTTSIGNLCRWHASADPQHWPRVTEQMLALAAELAMERQRPKPATKAMTREEKMEILSRLRGLQLGVGDKEWAHRLSEREGANLTQAQRAMWRAALAR